MSDNTDRYFAEDMKISDFQFDKKVVDVFDDMVARVFLSIKKHKHQR